MYHFYKKSISWMWRGNILTGEKWFGGPLTRCVPVMSNIITTTTTIDGEWRYTVRCVRVLCILCMNSELKVLRHSIQNNEKGTMSTPSVPSYSDWVGYNVLIIHSRNLKLRWSQTKVPVTITKTMIHMNSLSDSVRP